LMFIVILFVCECLIPNTLVLTMSCLYRNA
jgi:hypothetical protein